jgi:dCMP deaminase
MSDRRLPWDVWFVLLADFIAQRSKDPSTQCGAVIVRPDNTIAATGYNGFPRGIEDKPELLANREEKYKRVIHAEMNAILTAREPLHGYTLYVSPMPCCERCAVCVVQAGIKKVVYPVPSEARKERWGNSFELSHAVFDEAGVERVMIGADMKVAR